MKQRAELGDEVMDSHYLITYDAEQIVELIGYDEEVESAEAFEAAVEHHRHVDDLEVVMMSCTLHPTGPKRRLRHSDTFELDVWLEVLKRGIRIPAAA